MGKRNRVVNLRQCVEPIVVGAYIALNVAWIYFSWVVR